MGPDKLIAIVVLRFPLAADFEARLCWKNDCETQKKRGFIEREEGFPRLTGCLMGKLRQKIKINFETIFQKGRRETIDLRGILVLPFFEDF